MKIFLEVMAMVLTITGGFSIFLVAQNKDELKITSYEYKNALVEEEFDGFKILQLSDVHNHSLKYINTNIIDEIEKASPDIVVCTGDFIDNHTPNLDSLDELFSYLEKYDTYYVNGNHEAYANYQDEFQELLKVHGITGDHYLLDKATTITKNGKSFNLLGVHDPFFETKDKTYLGNNAGLIPSTLDKLNEQIDKDKLTLLLSHRPELMDIYVEKEMDLVFTGHTHGGQMNFPLVGTPFVANQIIPHYVYGYKTKENTSMVVSSGLGYTYNMQIRWRCPAEITIVTLKTN